jgi:hypothetical protein
MTRIRLQTEWADRAMECAAAIEEPLLFWTRLAANHYTRGAFSGVTIPPESLIVTRDNSRPIHVPDLDMDPQEMRKAIVAGVLFAEARRIRQPLPLVEGKNCIVEEWK